MVDAISTAYASKMVLPLGHGSPNGYCISCTPEIRKTKDMSYVFRSNQQVFDSSKSCFRNSPARLTLELRNTFFPANTVCHTPCCECMFYNDEIFAKIARWCTAADTGKKPQISQIVWPPRYPDEDEHAYYKYLEIQSFHDFIATFEILTTLAKLPRI